MEPDEVETRIDVDVGPPSVLAALSKAAGQPVDPQVDLDGDRTRTAPPEPGRATSPGAALPAPSPPSYKYQIVEEIGRGGIGRVVRARDRDLRRSVAMKMLLPRRGGAGGREALSVETRFLEEAQITAQLSHPGIVPVHELGVAPDGSAYFTMAVVRGMTLADAFAAARTPGSEWTQTRILGVLQRVCDTVGYAHDRGVVHRDLKPANVMVGRFGEVYVMDWGLARVRGRNDGRDLRPGEPPATIIESDRPSGDGEALRTLDGTVLGTPAYMPPEQAEGRQDDVGPRSDVYSIGAMLYEFLAGHPPYMRPGTRMPAYVLLGCIVMGPPASLSDLAPSAPEELRRIAERAMARDPAMRQATAAALGADIQSYLDGTERARREAAAREAEAAEARARSEVVLSVVLDRVREPVEEVGRVEAVRGIADVVRQYLDAAASSAATPASLRLHAAVMRWLSDVEGRVGTSEQQLRWAKRAIDVAATVPIDDSEFRRERVRILVSYAEALHRVGDQDGAIGVAGSAARDAESLLLGDADDEVHRIRFAASDALRRILRPDSSDEFLSQTQRAESALRAITSPTWADRLLLAEFLVSMAAWIALGTRDEFDGRIAEAESLIAQLERERPGTWQTIQLNGELKLVTGLRYGKRGLPTRAVQDQVIGTSLLLHVEAMDPQNPRRRRAAARALAKLGTSLRSAGRNDEAIAKYEESLRRCRAACDTDPLDRAAREAFLDALVVLGRMLIRSGRNDLGSALIDEHVKVAEYEESLRRRRAACAANAGDRSEREALVGVLRQFGSALCGTRDHERGIALLEEGIRASTLPGMEQSAAQLRAVLELHRSHAGASDANEPHLPA